MAGTSNPLERASLSDLESLRLLLAGSSVIDWRRVSFTDAGQVDRFLLVNEFNPASPQDLDRLEVLREDAVEYLTRNFGYRIPEDVAEHLPVKDLFLLAATQAPSHLYACLVLKVMHVMHHLAGRELTFKLPVSDDELFAFVESKVVRVVEEIRAAGFPIVEFAWSRKERDSVVTKLLAKKASIAAHVYDKLRFRLITASRSDLPAVLLELVQRLVPFNYIIPGESVNNIISFPRLFDDIPVLRRYLDQMQEDVPSQPSATSVGNEFSGPTYRAINFVVDMPVRIDALLAQLDDPAYQDFGSIIFVLTEFQVMDQQTTLENEQGANSHAAYKARQQEQVRLRLQCNTTMPAPFRSGESDVDGEDDG